MPGLSSADAAARLRDVGPNALPERPPEPIWRRFFRQFASPLIYILLFALAFDLGLWVYEGADAWPVDALAIAVILLLNAGLGLYQEYRSEGALAHLRALAGAQTWALRDGQLVRISTSDVVPGDWLRLEAGDRIPADGRLREAHGAMVDESMLTGEDYVIDVGLTLDYSATNLSDDATSPQVALRNKTVSFVDALNKDYHLAVGDTNAMNQGTSLAADGNLAFSDDIDRHNRPHGAAWDIGADEYPSGLFAYRRLVTFSDAMTPASCTSDLSGFPVMVSVTDDDLKASPTGHVNSSLGYDIVFRALDGVTQLDHEIEKYDPATGQLIAWVRIPTLAYNADTSFYMYYGKSGITSPTANPGGVWDANYAGVWHLKEDGDGIAGEYDDSTQNANEGQGGRGNTAYVPKQTGGLIGYGQQFDNTVDGKYDLLTRLSDFTGAKLDALKAALRCPYGQPGDRLWVRETWGVMSHVYIHEAGAWEGDGLVSDKVNKDDIGGRSGLAVMYRADGYDVAKTDCREGHSGEVHEVWETRRRKSVETSEGPETDQRVIAEPKQPDFDDVGEQHNTNH